MSAKSVILINTLKARPGQQDALIALLQHNTETVIRTLDGWVSTRLVAVEDGASVVIWSEWEAPEAIAAMRRDPRMTAYFPQILALASLDSLTGRTVLYESR